MRKKRQLKRKKHATKPDASINEVTLARLEAVKSKRQETIAMVKQRLDEKFKERFALTRGDALKEQQENENLLCSETKSSNEKIMTQIREEMKSVMLAGVEKVHAAKVLEEKIKFDAKTSTMLISGKKYKIKKNVHAIGWGREALMMSKALEKTIGNNLKKGFVVVPRKTVASMSIYPELFPKLDTCINFTEAQSDNVPDEICVRATKNIADYCKKLKKKDILIVMLSRGSDDFLCLPRGTTGLEEKMVVLEHLREAGATAREIGIVRKTLSAIRGGGLASLAHPAKVISLVMSDLGADDIHLQDISGGPTFNTNHRDLLLTARGILDKYDIRAHKLSHGIREILTDHHESAMTIDKPFESIADNHIVASSKDSLDEMAIAAFRYGYVPIKIIGTCDILSNNESMSMRRISKDYTRLVSLMILAVENKITRTEMYQDMRENIVTFDMTEDIFLNIFPSKENWARGLYLLISPPSDFMNNLVVSRSTREFGNSNRTGNNQELAIYFSLDWYLRVEQYPILREYIVWFLGGSSNGRDGNTKYAGAYAYGNLAVEVYRKFWDYDFSESLETNDATNEDSYEEKRALHESILPDQVLASGNANLFFVNVNDGEELLKLGDVNGCTQTRVGDLHVVRIVRCECSCDGRCTRQ